MQRIHTLPDDVARRIAAGEVVERPASVVKELVENAIDAGAHRISVRTSGAGEDLIEVTDDGCGMSQEDIVVAPRNFSTSKITQPEDLHRISTYGFRGEALAAISSVSRFEIISSDNDQGEGWRVAIEGKSTTANQPAPHQRGTTVRVRDLFFNTPARKRFLKTPLTERKRILETILGFAMVMPELEIHYIDDNRHVIDLLPAHSWRERVASILGATTMKHIVDLDSGAGRVAVKGFVSLPSFTRGNRTQQFFFVNNRLVREKTLIHALSEAFRNVIPYRRFPVAVISVEMPPDEVDVNVHPSKLEVRVRNESMVFGTVKGAVKAALSAESESQLSVSALPSMDEPATSASAAPGLPLVNASDPGSANVISLQERIRDAFTDYTAQQPAASTSQPFNPPLSLRTGATDDKSEVTREAVEKSIGDEGLFWQFNNSYILIQVRGGIVVIDQHAAHERIIYDTSRKQVEGTSPPSQQILFSIHLELSMAELEVFRTSHDVFRQLGFDLEPFGGKSILVRGYPQGLHNWDEGKILLQVFDDILQERFPGDTVGDQVLASFACRSAIKAGQKLGVEEMRMLADQLFAVENPYSCPHGRPTIHRLSLEEIEKWFLRR